MCVPGVGYAVDNIAGYSAVGSSLGGEKGCGEENV